MAFTMFLPAQIAAEQRDTLFQRLDSLLDVSDKRTKLDTN